MIVVIPAIQEENTRLTELSQTVLASVYIGTRIWWFKNLGACWQCNPLEKNGQAIIQSLHGNRQDFLIIGRWSQMEAPSEELTPQD